MLLPQVPNGNTVMMILVMFLVWNLYAFLLMGWDKRQAKRHGQRIPEKKLFAIALFFGALGLGLGMRLFRHKTMHRSFNVGVPIMLVVNLVVIAGMGRWIINGG
jgi:uncharacterized membrane protein YsdA (DUF1294 family)